MSEALKNMKFSEAENGGHISDGLLQDKPKYPYGLRINLDPVIIERLNLGKLPEPGQMMRMVALVEVVEVRLENAQNGGRDKHICLQITDMDLQAKTPEQSEDDNDYSKPRTILGS